MKTVIPRKSLCICTMLLISAFANLFAEVEKPNIEKAIADAEKAVETRQPDYQVSAFELSVYYQGFTPEIIGTLDRFDEHGIPFRSYNDIPRDCDLKRPIKIRDAMKAFYYAQIANDEKHFMVYGSSNLADLYIKGIGVEKNIDKAIEILGKDIFSEHFIRTYGQGGIYEAYAPLIAYIYYKGIGIKKDIKRSEEILALADSKYAWRNFYCGYLVPKDYDFAIYCLENRKEFWAAEALARIYSGEYLPENADKTKAEHWRKIAIERRKEFFKEKAEYINGKIRQYAPDTHPLYIIKTATLLGARKFYFNDDWLYENVEMENPFYDLKAAIALIDNLDRRYADNPNEREYLSRLYKEAGYPEKWESWPGDSWRYVGPISEYFKERAKEYSKTAKQK